MAFVMAPLPHGIAGALVGILVGTLVGVVVGTRVGTAVGLAASVSVGVVVDLLAAKRNNPHECCLTQSALEIDEDFAPQFAHAL